MYQPVHQSSRHDPIPYEIRPLGKFEIAGDNGTSHLISPGQNLEQKVGVFLIQRHVSKLVHDKKLTLVKSFKHAGQVFLRLGLRQLGCQITGTPESYGVTSPDGLHAKSNRNMRLAVIENLR